MVETEAHFRFLDLPPEIRKQIFKELLCSFSFKPARTSYHYSRLASLMDQEEYYVNKAVLYVHTSILLVSRAIYHEAYDVMIKTNQFIRVQVFNLSLSSVLPQYKIPIINMDRQRTSQFLGYVLDFSIHGAITSGFVEENSALKHDCKPSGARMGSKDAYR
jgi:hypothetical protein